MRKGIAKYTGAMASVNLADAKREELEGHKRIRLTRAQSSALCFNNNVKCCDSLLRCLCPAQKKLKAVYKIGKEKVDKDFDLLKLIRDMKNLKMLTRFHIRPTEEIKVQIAHCLKNVIDLDCILHEEAGKHHDHSADHAHACDSAGHATHEGEVRPSFYRRQAARSHNEVN